MSLDVLSPRINCPMNHASYRAGTVFMCMLSIDNQPYLPRSTPFPPYLPRALWWFMFIVARCPLYPVTRLHSARLFRPSTDPWIDRCTSKKREANIHSDLFFFWSCFAIKARKLRRDIKAERCTLSIREKLLLYIDTVSLVFNFEIMGVIFASRNSRGKKGRNSAIDQPFVVNISIPFFNLA